MAAVTSGILAENDDNTLGNKDSLGAGAGGELAGTPSPNPKSESDQKAYEKGLCKKALNFSRERGSLNE
jgi:hypothetical protein